jgi:hypothetical protein
MYKKNRDNKISKLKTIQQYPNTELLTSVCKSFEQDEISFAVTHRGKSSPTCNCNAVGGLLENVFFPIIQNNLSDFKEGPKQATPDYFGMNKRFEFEQKTFMKKPGFSLENFTSYVNILCEDGVSIKNYSKLSI